jgi:hypothetical protein
MSDVSDITQVTISRTTQSVAREAYGIPAIISEFSTGKTTVTFERHRFYASAAEMVTDGWGTTDPEYNAAVIIFAQSPRKVERIMIGRIDSTDASLSAALTAIQAAVTGWYAFMVIGHMQTQTVFDADFIAANSIVFTVNGTAVAPVVYAVSHANTMTLIKTAIEAAITNSVVTVGTADTDDPDNRTVLISVDGKAPTVDVAVTLGASQPTDATGGGVTSLAFDADFNAGNSIVVTVNGTAVTAVPYNASHAQTMADLKTQIETDITDCVCVITDKDPTGRTIEITVNGNETDVSEAITGGTPPTGTITNNLTDAYTLASAWAETQRKIFFCASSLDNIIGSGSADIASVLEALNRDRTSVSYHTSCQGDAAPAWKIAGWLGELLPYDPGSQTWAYKTLASVASYELTPTQRTNVLAKNCNIYTETGGVDVTEEGKVVSGEWIDVIRGIDWVTSTLQENIFQALIDVRKIPYTDEGITLMVGVVTGVLYEAAAQGILVESSIVVTAPLAADVSAANKAARLLPDINFTATLQGAIQSTEINGVVTV